LVGVDANTLVLLALDRPRSGSRGAADIVGQDFGDLAELADREVVPY